MDGQIDRQHPLARNLIVLGGDRGDLVNGGPWQLIGSGSSLVPTPYGAGVKATTTGDGGYFAFPSRALIGATSLTVSVFAALQPVPQYQVLLSSPDTGGYGNNQILFYAPPGEARLLFSTALSGGISTSTGGAFFLGDSRWHHYAVTADLGGMRATWYRDGSPYLTASIPASAAGVGAGNLAQLCLFLQSSAGTGGASNQQTGQAAAPAIWSRALAASEIAAITSNPYSMLRTRRKAAA